MICQEISSGESLENIAKYNRLTKRRIQQILKDNNIEINQKKRRDRKVKIKYLLALGYTKKWIAKELSISRQRLHQIIKEERLDKKT